MQSKEQHEKLCHEIAEQSKKIAMPLEETDQDSLKSLLSQQPYTKENIAKCAQHLLEEYNFEYKQQFGLIENLDSFDQIFESLDQSKQPLFFGYDKGEDCWILFCVVQDENKKSKVLYKDSFDDAMDKELEVKIRSKLGDVKIEVNGNKDVNANAEKHLYGPVFLRNLKTLLKAIHQDNSRTVDKFEALQFPSTAKVFNDRLRKVLSLTVQLAENEEFLSALKKYTELLLLKFCFDAMNARNKNDPKPETLQIFEQSQEVDEFEKNIRGKFAVELQNLEFILKIIFEVSELSYVFRLLQTICGVLKLDFDKIMSSLVGDFVDSTGTKHNASAVINQALEVENSSLENLVNQVLAEMDGLGSALGTSAVNETLQKSTVKDPGMESDFCSGEETTTDKGENNLVPKDDVEHGVTEKAQ